MQFFIMPRQTHWHKQIASQVIKVESPEIADNQSTTSQSAIFSQIRFKLALTDSGADSDYINIGNRSEDENRNNGVQRSARLVDVGKDTRSISSLSEGSEGSGSSIYTRKTDREHRNTDGRINEI